MIVIKKNSLKISIKNQDFDLPFLWLRDNCECNQCRIKETEEKQFLLHTVSVNIKPAKVDSDHENLLIRWEDNHITTISLNKILQSSIPRYPKHKFWPKSFLPSKFGWDDFLKDKNTALKALKDFVQYGAIILKGAPRKLNSLELLSKRLGPIHETLFERIHNVSVTGHVYNVAHTSKGLPPHNDFASYKAQPSVQALHMLENECEGGESIIVDSLKLLNDFKEDHPKFFNILTQFDVPFREFDDHNETYAEEPLIKCKNNGSVESFRFSNQLMQMINPLRKGINDFYKAFHELSSRIYNHKYRCKFRLNSGEVLIIASHRVLHAREEFVPNGQRHLQDAYFVYDNAANNIVLLSN